MDSINHLLAHQLATNAQVLAHHGHVKNVLSQQRLIALCEQQDGLDEPVMHRWNLRLASLIAPSVPSPLRTIGFELLHFTFSASTTSLLDQGKATLAIALNVLASPKSDASAFVAALQLVKLVLAKSQWHPDWAREVVGAPVVQRTVNALVSAAQGTHFEKTLASLDGIITLIPLFPTALRPLAPSIHSLAIHCISATDASPELLSPGSELFASLYLLAPKGRDGLREAWKKGVESLIGTIDSLVLPITSDIFAEDPMTNHTLAPLALPPFSSGSTFAVLARVESLSSVLRLLLRMPTTDRVGSVEIPLGALCELGCRLVGLNSETPIKERVDPSLVSATLSLLPQLQLVGCQLLAQIATCVGPRLSPHATEVLSTLARTLSTYAPRSPLRPTLTTTYSIVLKSLGASVDPEEGKRSLARVWRVVLEDIGAVAVEPTLVNPASSSNEKNGSIGSKSRKNKKQKTYDPSEALALSGKRPTLDEVDLEIAMRSLSTLNLLLSLPHSVFLPPKLQLSTSRLLLFISLSYTSTTSTSSQSSSIPHFSSPRSPTNSLQLAYQHPGFIPLVLSCLLTSLRSGIGAQGTIDRSSSLFSHLLSSTTPEIIRIARDGLTYLGSIVHPFLPPPQMNTSLARQKKEAMGGDLGEEMDVSEFGIRVPLVEDSEQMEEEEDTEEEDEEGERKRKEVVRRRRQEAREKIEADERRRISKEAQLASQVVPTFSAGAFGSTSFGAKANEAETKEAVPEEEKEQEVVEMTEHVEIVVDMTPSVAVPRDARDDEDSSDDEDDDDKMPTIHMDSDEEE